GAAEQHEPRAAHLRGTRQVQNAKLLGDVPVRRNAAGLTRLTPAAEPSILRLAARRYILDCRVRKLQQNAVEFTLCLTKATLEAGNLLSERATLRHQLIGVRTSALELRNLLAVRVALRLALLNLLDQCPSFGVQLHRSRERFL